MLLFVYVFPEEVFGGNIPIVNKSFVVGITFIDDGVNKINLFVGRLFSKDIYNFGKIYFGYSLIVFKKVNSLIAKFNISVK